MSIRRLTLSILIAAAVAGCGQAGQSAGPGAATASPSASVVLRTEEAQLAGTMQSCMAAVIEGPLVRHDASGLALQPSQGPVIEVIWPTGYSAHITGERIVLVGASGEMIALEGDRVSVGGGQINAGKWPGCGGAKVVAP